MSTALTNLLAIRMNSANTTTVIVARHGERLDYYLRDFKDSNYLSLPTTQSPWDPPLTNRGRLHGKALGAKIQEVLYDLNNRSENSSIHNRMAHDDDVKKIAPLSFVYASPMIRCVQTAMEAVKGYNYRRQQQYHENDEDSNNDERLKVRIEPGLMESMNEKWYRSWCLPDSNGTWGGPDGQNYTNGNFPPSAKSITIVHESAKIPCYEILSSGCEIKQKLIELAKIEENGSVIDDSITKKAKQKFRMGDNSELADCVQTAPENVYTKKPNYCWESFESRNQLDARVEETIESLAAKHPNQTILVLSHGSPCTKLYERLTGDNWETHGVCTYACFSLYQRCNGNDVGKKKWKALVVNDSSHVKEIEASLQLDKKVDESYQN